MNLFELLLSLIVAGAGIVFAVKRWGIRAESCCLAIAVTTAVMLAFAGSTQFFTYDETYISSEIVSVKNAAMDQWAQNAFRTSAALDGAIMHLVRALTRLPFHQYQMLAKGLHGLIGILLLLVIEEIIRRTWFTAGGDALFAIIFISLAGLLPIMLFGLKLLQYDLYAMLFGALAVVIAALGIARSKPRWILASTIPAFLAAQEKVSGSPILIFTITAYALWPFFSSSAAAHTKSAGKILARYFLALAAACAVNGATHLILWINRFGRIPPELLQPAVVLGPLFSCAWFALRGWCGLEAANGLHVVSKSNPLLWIAVLSTAYFIISAILGIGLIAGRRFLMPGRERGVGGRPLACAGFVLFILAWAVGVAGLCAVDLFYAHRTPIPAGRFSPWLSFNGLIEYYGARTAFGHYALSLLRAYAEFANAIPAAMLAALALCAWVEMRSWRRQTEGLPSLGMLDAAATLSLLAPAAFALTQTPVSARYYNLFLLLLGLAFAIKTASALARWKRPAGLAAAAILFVVALAEVAPFAPIFAAFRPFWCNYPPSYRLEPANDAFKPSWNGWGEELMLAGKWIIAHEKDAGTAQRPITLHLNYLGQWLDKGPHITVRWWLREGLSYTANDYYILNRIGLLYGHGRFPQGIPPLHTITFRGFAQAWVYRGDQLAAAGFRF